VRYLPSVGLAVLLLLSVSARANAKNCSIPFFSFNLSSEGPWAAYMTVREGKSCEGHRWQWSGTLKRLFLKAAPSHGAVALSFPGGYRYSPTPGYLGDDAFTLRLCGSSLQGRDGCADLHFTVKVVNGSI
jgi:hypothetical protein